MACDLQPLKILLHCHFYLTVPPIYPLSCPIKHPPLNGESTVSLQYTSQVTKQHKQLLNSWNVHTIRTKTADFVTNSNIFNDQFGFLSNC